MNAAAAACTTTAARTSPTGKSNWLRHITTPETVMQLIVPPALMLMSVRFVLKGIGSFIAATKGGERIEEVHELAGVDLEKGEG